MTLIIVVEGAIFGDSKEQSNFKIDRIRWSKKSTKIQKNNFFVDRLKNGIF